ncbi:MAG: hypothetical protein COA97_00410 [Flavobacteriales bacterium]|nr:MAG: hypothetical protein COA97_00410 [Flavobacteriales bacterium]
MVWINKIQMKDKVFILLVVLFACFIPKVQFAAIVYSNGTGGGAWGAAGSWTPGVPACGDTIYILAGDVITVETQQDYSEPGCTSPMFIIIDGTLDFPVNGQKLRLPCGSGITINPGGAITASSGGGGGSSNFIEICGSIVWKKSDGTVTGPSTLGDPLPINLISFEANVNEDRIDIKWVTASEINNDFFTLERSIDAENWEVVIVTGGAGNSSQILEYYEVDYEPIVGISYYRLKQTDFDGKYEYFNIVPVKYEQNVLGDGFINLFPNPVSSGETVYIDFTNILEKEMLVVLRDIRGREYYSKVIVNIEEGKLVGVPIEKKIPVGLYLITATSENQMYSQKLIIKSSNHFLLQD